MKSYPSLKFLADSNRDFEIYKGFIQSARVFDLKEDLEKSFYRLYPELKMIEKKIKSSKKKDKLIKDYIEKIYQKDSSQIYKKGIREARKQWQIIQKPFFKETSNIFKQHAWPKGKYIGCITIWGIYPRFLYDKTFSFPYQFKNKNFISLVIMHEMLHFLFYDYVIKKYPEIFKKLETEKGIFWDLAEVFNVIILSLPRFKKLHKVSVKTYPEHKKYFFNLKKLWKKTEDIDLWLIEGYGYVKNKGTRKT